MNTKCMDTTIAEIRNALRMVKYTARLGMPNDTETWLNELRGLVEVLARDTQAIYEKSR